MIGTLLQRRISGWNVLLLAALGGMLLPSIQQLRATAQSIASDLKSHDYRRVFVPADRPVEWPVGAERYLPVERVEFERLIREARERQALHRSGGAQLLSAEYQARLVENDVLEGTALFEVKLTEETPSVALLAPWNAIVGAARWLGGDGEKPATIGLWRFSDAAKAEDQYGALTTQSGELAVDWRAVADVRLGDDLEFALRFPQAVVQRFELELPVGYTPTLPFAQLAEPASEGVGGDVRWVFQLAGDIEHRLRIRRPTGGAAAPATAKLPLASVVEAYRLTVDGLDYQADFRIQNRGVPLGEVRLRTPPNLRVASVTVNQQPAAWRRDQQDAASLLVAVPTTARPTTVTIVGAAPLTLDVPWRLPSIAVQGVFWTEGTSTLWIDPSLELQAIVPHECSVVNALGVGGGDGGEVFRLQAWSNAAGAEIIVADRSSRWHCQSAATVELADHEMTVQCRAMIWASNRRAYHLVAPLEPEWTVESVNAVPADAIVDWHVEEGKQRRLHLQLRRSPSENEPLRMTLTARKPWQEWTRIMNVGDLSFVQLPSLSDNPLLFVKDRRGRELLPDRRLMDAIVDIETLSQSQRELLEDVTGGLLLDLAVADAAANVSVAAAEARYVGEGWMELTAAEAGFDHRVQIACRPTAGSVSELRIRATRPLPPDVHWKINDAQESGDVVVQRIEPAAHGTEYRVRLSSPRSKPFQLSAAWRSEMRGEETVNSFALPEADAWQSWAILRGKPERIRVNSHGATPATAVPPASDGDDHTAVLGCFRLGDDPSPQRRTLPSLIAKASTDVDGSSPVSVVSWLYEATTRQYVDGHQSHRIVYQLEVRRPDDVELTVPPGARVTSILVDGRTVDAMPSQDFSKIRIRLNAEPNWRTLVVDVESLGKALGRSATITPVLPRTSFPALRGQWTLVWPASYAVVTDERFATTGSWLKRLTGPFVDDQSNDWSDELPMSKAMAAASPSATTMAGWLSSSQPFVLAPVPVRLSLVAGRRAVWHVVGLLAAVVAGWAWPRYPRFVVAAIAAAALVCLTVPEQFVPLPQGIFLGALAGTLARRLFAFFSQPTSSWRRVALSLSSALIVGVPSVMAQTSPPRVFFPVDEKGQTVGDDVYVPVPLAAELFPATPKQPSASAALIDAVYQIQLRESSAAGDVECTNCVARIQWQTFRPNVRVALPFRRDDGAEDESQFTLDGEPIAPVWDEAGRELTIEIAEPGIHEFHAVLSPHSGEAVAGGRWRLRIPPLPGATVVVDHPVGLKEISAAAATVVPASSNATQTTLRLSPVKTLDITWPARILRKTAGVTVEQLSILEINPAAAQLEARLRLSGDGSNLDSLTLATSPQLKLLPLPDGSPVHEQPTPVSSGTVKLTFRSPPQLPLMIPLRFQLQRTVSMGQIDYPMVRAVGLATKSRRFVVAVDPRLRIRDEIALGLTPIGAKDLESLWGSTFSSAALQYAVDVEDPEWSADVTPAPPRFTLRESLELVCEEDRVKATYFAAVADADADVLVHQIAVDPELQIDEVAVTRDDGSVPLRWARPRPDQLHAFLGQPIRESHHLSVVGHIDYAASLPAGVDKRSLPASRRQVQRQRAIVPRIGLESAVGTPIDLSVYRSKNVLVEWAGALPPLKPSAGFNASSQRRFVGQYEFARGGEPPVELTVTPNDASFTADVLLTLDLSRAEPTATCDLHGQATGGIVDSIRFLVDKNWQGPFSVEPGAKIVRRDFTAAAKWQTLDVQLARPIAAGEQFSLSVSGAVSPAEMQRIRFPSLWVVGAERQRIYIALPPDADDLTAAWTLRGLEPETLPSSLAAARRFPAAPRSFRVQRERFLAEQRIFPDAMRTADYRFVETCVDVDANGDAVALSRLIVQSGGGADCRVKLPAGARLEYAAVDGAAAFDSALHDNAWQPSAGSRYLPRVFLLSYRMPRFAREATRRLQPPQVVVDGKTLTPDVSLWQIADDGTFSLVEGSANGAALLDRSQFTAMARRAQINAALDAAPLASQLPEWESRLWHQPWIDRLASTDAQPSADDPPAWKKLQERFADARPTPDESPIDPYAQWTKRSDGVVARYRGDSRGEVQLTPRTDRWEWGRWTAAFMLAGAVGAAWRWPSKLQPLRESWRRWPYAAAIGAGTLWWLTLSPGWIGLAIVVVALAMALKSRIGT